MPHLPGDRLALVRKLYEASELTIAEIAILADVSESAIYQRARREQWPSTRRPGITPRKMKLRPPLPPTPALAALSSPALAGEPETPQPGTAIGDLSGGNPLQAGAGTVDRAPSGDEAIDRAATAARLWRAIDLHLQDLHALAAPADTIRGAQSFSALARSLQTLVDVERGLAQDSGAQVGGAQVGRGQARAARGHDPDEGPEDIDDFRNEIARRLEALLASHTG